MKPTKNRYFCKACRRPKMLFETESQANTFIKFNSTEIDEENGHAPVRSYYCNICMGWHVTSNPNVQFFETFKSRAETVIEDFQDQEAHKLKGEAGVVNRAELAVKGCKFIDAARLYMDAYNLAFQSGMDSKDRCVSYLSRAEEALKQVVDSFNGGSTPTQEDAKALKSVINRINNAAARINYTRTVSDIDMNNILSKCQKIDSARANEKSDANRADIAYEDGSFIDAADWYIQAFACGIQTGNDEECMERCSGYLAKAAEALIKSAEAIKNGQVHDPEFYKKGKSCLKRIIKHATNHGIEGLLDKETADELTATFAVEDVIDSAVVEVLDAKKAEKERKQRLKRLEGLRRSLNEIEVCISLGQISYSENLINIATKGVENLYAYDDVRDQLLPIVNRLIEFKEMCLRDH